MFLESEVYGLILVCFSIVAVLSALILGFLFWKSRHRGILWFCGQLASLCGAFVFFFQALIARYDPQFSMYSEEQSLRIAMAGILWAVSMIFMLVGIYKLLRKGPVIHQF